MTSETRSKFLGTQRDPEDVKNHLKVGKKLDTGYTSNVPPLEPILFNPGVYCLFVCLFTRLFVCLFVCFFVFFTWLFACLCACMLVQLIVCLLVCLIDCLLVCLFVCLFVRSFICLSCVGVS